MSSAPGGDHDEHEVGVDDPRAEAELRLQGDHPGGQGAHPRAREELGRR